jgi:outer membrane receptor protein involved in Fe transport
MRKSSLLVGTTFFAVAAAMATPALAQDAPAPVECVDENANGVCDSDEEGAGTAIVVTGTRIARPTLNSSVPLTSVTTEDLQGTGELSLGDALNDLPSLRSTFSSGNSSRFIGTAGLSLLDLRGLGTDRTLVLVNGRRHVTSTPGDNGFDVNTIPTDLVERIDIVTGGNSAVYGSDAVAGVVNFILRRDYEGISLRGQAGISSRGDRGTYFLSGIFGENFADGRGNIALAVEYTRQEPLLSIQRDDLTGAFSGRCQYQLTDVSGGEPAAGDGIPDSTFQCGIRSGSISDGGTIGLVNGTTGAFLRFANDGTLFVDTPPATFRQFGSGNNLGGLGSTLNNSGSLLAAVDRYAVNLLSHFDVSDAFRPFVEAKFVRTKVAGDFQPTFFPSAAAAPSPRCNNGFLTNQALLTLQSFGLCTNVATGTFSFSRFNNDVGGRNFRGQRDTYRIVAGIDGSFNDDWRYEVAVNYGRFEAFGRNTGQLLLRNTAGQPDGFNLAIDAVLAPAGFTGTNFALNPAGQRVICRVNEVTNNRPDCVPINLFGENNADPRALNFSRIDGTIDEFADQLVFSGFVSGDFSQLFELPGGPISFALGAEYRRERANTDFDDATNRGQTSLNVLQDFCPPGNATDICPDDLTIKELYGELQFPLLENVPFARELAVTLAGRVSDYNNSTGTVYAYNIQGVYAPIDDVRFRVAYATSVRAPSQGELFSPQSQNFGTVADPCDQLNINLGPNRVANCAAAGVPTTVNAALAAACVGTAFPVGVGAPFTNCTARTSSTAFVSGGNPTLQEERGKSLTVGVVFEPSFLPGLNLTVDYYDIEVTNLIAALSAQGIITLCYDSDSGLNNPFCATVNRDPATGLFAIPAVVSGGINFAKQETRGIDFDLSYRRTFDNGDRLQVRAIATRVLALNNFTDPTVPILPNRQLSELGDPQWAASFNFSYDFGNWDILYSARYIGKQTIGAYETQNSYTGLCPASGVTPNTGGINGAAVPCTAGTLVRVAPNNLDAFDRIHYPDVLYHDIRVGFDVADRFRLTAGVSNLLDRQPPLGLLGTAGGDPFDSFGRNFFVGFRAEF